MLVLIELIPITSFVVVSSATKIYRWLGNLFFISEKLFIECCIRALCTSLFTAKDVNPGPASLDKSQISSRSLAHTGRTINIF